MRIKHSSKPLHRVRDTAAGKWLCLAVVLLVDGCSLNLLANPTGMTVALGRATPQTSGAQLNVTVSQAALLNWSSFNIQAGETTTFIQPSANSVVLNEIGGASASQIFGNLNANGTVILANANGFFFGPNSMIKVGGDFIATTAPITPDFGSGSSWTFTGMPPLKSIINYGSIQAGNGRSLFLIAEDIENHGSLNAPGGNIGLAAGQTVLVSERPDGRGLSASVQVPAGTVNNLGQITADAGTIALQAQTVNQNGIVQANSVQDQNGVIELVAADQLTLGANSQIIATGDNSPGGSAGGNVTLKSGNTFSDNAGSQIIATGGAHGGNGGNVEISAPKVLSLNSGIDARAQAGWTAGKLLLDPDYIILDTSGAGSAGGGTVLAGSNPGSTLDLNVNSAFANLAVSQIILQAAYDITLAGGTTWNLSGTIGAHFGGVTGGQLTLEAGRNIIFGNGAKLTDANNWSATLLAGYDFVNNVVQSGVGNIYLNGGSGQTGSGAIQLSKAILNLTAGNSIVIGTGCQLTDDGGTIGLYASTVNQNGLIQANSVGGQQGIIDLVASDSLALGANSQIAANGDNLLGGSAGGSVTLQSGNTFSDSAGSEISVTGGSLGGDGGSVEISAPNVLSLNSSLDASAPNGSAGQFTLNTQNIALNNSGGSGIAVSEFENFSQINLQASGDISLADNTTWNLGAANGQAILNAAGDISLGNGSQIIADGGTIRAYGNNLELNGTIQANSVGSQHGIIELDANDSITLGVNSKITANGDGSVGGSSGGQIMLQAVQTFADSSGSQIQARGGANGGAGGRVLVYAAPASVNSQLDVSAQPGSAAGSIFYYPKFVARTLTAGWLAPFSGFTHLLFQANNDITLADSSLFAGFSSIQLQTLGGSITLNPSTTWNLSGSTGQTVGQLTLQAGSTLVSGSPVGGDIVFGDGALITDANHWSVTLQAGYDFVNNVVQSGNGSIFLNNNSGDNTGGGWIQTAAGNINLIAGQDILLGGGSVFTTGGGGVFADALAGSINLGSWNGGTSFTRQTTGYLFGSSGVTPNTVLGGFSTAAGGDVTLIAGNNVDNTASVTTGTWPGESGAYGAGDVTVIAGNQITGNFVVANGTGTLLAGVPVSSAQAAQLQNPNADPAAAATALNELETAVQQAQNPNGNIGAPSGASGPVTLSLINGSWNTWAANNIYLKEVNNPDGAFNAAASFLFSYAPDAAANLWAGNAIELTGNNLHRVASQKTPIVYAPILNLNAGAGGILIDKSVLLYPSSQGSLHITTRNGGNLTGKVNPSTTALTGITMSDGNPADYQTFASGYSSPPLHLNDPNPVVLDISGSIGNFGLIVPTFAQITVDGHQPYVTAAGGSYYGTYNFGFSGQNLSQLQTTFIDVTGDITYPDYTPGATFGGQSLALTGPGNFNISARNIDLGFSGGITVLAPDAPLAAISPYGANLTVTTSGNLEMTSTAIANYSLLGGITLNVGVGNGGILDVGGPLTALGDPSVVKGIFTTSGGNISINAGGNINVDGSRIAAYDGGNINLTSQTGDVNAGAGGQGYEVFSALQLVKPDPNDPTTWYLTSIPADIPLSGILATTVAGYDDVNNTVVLSDAPLGNITINAPNGSINSSSGGILQIAFNAADTKNNFIDLTAGQNITANGSGVLGYNLNLKAGGNIAGLIYGSQNVNLTAQNNVDVTVVSGGNVDINAAGEVSGTVISGGNLDVSGSSITASLIAESVSASGDTSGASMGIPQSNVAKDNAETADDASTVASKTSDDDDDLKKKKKGKGATLAQKTGRVTVILPPKKKAETTSTLQRTENAQPSTLNQEPL